ncbi:hypothetical protein K2173_000728 [Erythroxylum novogranatense]|uniref:FGAR-AT PurM N-terminal-like domain-containing protein n=1 Tax=Erythroxylum novogranatense TaxID=1862640 RepID=A0AAV8SIC4_9ROSI|nr:hypothetical protein K2173_000728 [Erythroxylum novogranatense]
MSLGGLPPPPPAVNLELEKVLGDMPKKTFEFKRFTTHGVCDSLVAQQRNSLVLTDTTADVLAIAQTYIDLTEGACAIGEQPIKGPVDPKAMARLAVGEALTNLVWAKVTSLYDVKASGNWMYLSKLDGKGNMYDVCNGSFEAMIELGIAIDGGRTVFPWQPIFAGEVVKAPGILL